MSNTLRDGQRLYPNQDIWSSDRRYRLVYQGEGNLVVYDTHKQPAFACWHSETNGLSVGFFQMQTDGNAVVYDAETQPVWDSKTSGIPGCYLEMQTDGNLVVYASPRTPVWDSWSDNARRTSSPSQKYWRCTTFCSTGPDGRIYCGKQCHWQDSPGEYVPR